MADGTENKILTIAYIIHNINDSLGFRWVAKSLDKKRFRLIFISLGTSYGTPLEEYCGSLNISYYRVRYAGKMSAIPALAAVSWILFKTRTSLVHCHMVEASVIGLLAARLMGITNRIYTRHHSTYHFCYHPRGIKYDILCNRLATKIVAISNVVRDVLLEDEGASPAKIYLIPHGMDFDYLNGPSQRQTGHLRNKYNLKNQYPVIGVIARYVNWKGLRYAIEAFAVIKRDYPHALLILANAFGDDSEANAALSVLPNDSYVEIKFEKDIGALYRLFDVFVHVPIDPRIEAYGQVYVEALAIGIPSVFTMSGIAQEFVRHDINALVVDYKNSKEIAAAVRRILENPALKIRLIENGKKDVLIDYNLPKFINRLQTIYEN